MLPYHHFQLQGKITQALSFGNGHIHDTYRLVNNDPAAPDYLLQRINQQVFPQVEVMMNNIQQIAAHLQKSSTDLIPLTLIPSLSGQSFYRDERDDYWRTYLFIKDLKSEDIAKTTEQIYAGAQAFGQFLLALADFPAQQLSPVIPNFHNVISRLQILRQAVQEDKMQRVATVQSALRFVWEQADKMSTIERLGQVGKIPLRVTHNDTKFNNVLLDSIGKKSCVVDWDTVMPGYVHYDFGDGVRTTVTLAAEDETDLQLIQFDKERYQAFSEGYLSITSDVLTDLEKAYLPLSGALLAYIMGVRFLTDYLQGDYYYKIHYPTHNLIRTHSQLHLAKQILHAIN